ncbi:MAG: hypothetical protein LiPW15_564 [Parcubacteria group bacterium LiPW_15]|nr:MAG: hypothetical protein LiPW15_564 [Parcubacteria group bacterium LiPW_15]
MRIGEVAPQACRRFVIRYQIVFEDEVRVIASGESISVVTLLKGERHKPPLS